MPRVTKRGVNRMLVERYSWSKSRVCLKSGAEVEGREEANLGKEKKSKEQNNNAL